MTTGEQGRTAPDAEHYLDLSDVEDDTPAPTFDVALRGYDRRQVDEHVAGLRRMVAQLRAQLAVHERRRGSGDGDGGVEGRISDTIPEARMPAAAPLNAAGPPGEGVGPDMVGAFNDRLRGILQAAEQEAQLVRSRAAESLLAEHAESRAALADLRGQRDTVFDELVRLRGHLDDLVSNSGRPATPPGPPRPAGPWGGPARGPGGPGYGPRPPFGPPGPRGAPPSGAFPAAPGGPGPDGRRPAPAPDARPVGEVPDTDTDDTPEQDPAVR